jgi:hypothetical protein
VTEHLWVTYDLLRNVVRQNVVGQNIVRRTEVVPFQSNNIVYHKIQVANATEKISPRLLFFRSFRQFPLTGFVAFTAASLSSSTAPSPSRPSGSGPSSCSSGTWSTSAATCPRPTGQFKFERQRAVLKPVLSLHTAWLPDFSWFDISKRETIYQITTNILNGHKIYQMSEKGYNRIYTFSIPRLSKIHWDFWSENIPSGTPGLQANM